MKRNSFLLVIVLLNIFCLGCKGKEKMGFVSRDRMNFKIGEEILQCFLEKDEERFKSLFSKDVISNNPELDNEIRKLFKYCNGSINSFENYATSMETSIDGELNSTTYNTIFKVSIDGIMYLLFYIYTPKDLYDNKIEGVRSIRVIKESEREKYFCYWQDMKPGIFVPDE